MKKILVHAMKKILVLALALMVLAAASVFAETADSAGLDDGVETITLDSGISLTCNKNNFKIDVDENGDISGMYLGETLAPVGFNIVVAEAGDAETYMIEASAAHEAEMDKGACFDEENEWLSFNYINEVFDGYTSQVTVYARNFDGGCYIVTVYCYFENTEEAETETDESLGEAQAELETLLDSLSFAK